MFVVWVVGLFVVDFLTDALSSAFVWYRWVYALSSAFVWYRWSISDQLQNRTLWCGVHVLLLKPYMVVPLNFELCDHKPIGMFLALCIVSS